MVASPQQNYITPEEYLKLEEKADVKHEYIILETLQEYVLINVKRQRVECFRRNKDGLWLLQSYTDQDKYFQLQSVNFEAEMSALYEDVVFV